MTAAWMENLELLAEAPDGIKKLRELILELAVRGKLVPQDSSDEPASELLKRIAAEKARLVKEGKIKNQKALADIGEEEKPFELPEGWEWMRLAQGIIKLTDGEHISPPKALSGMPLLTAKDVTDAGVIFESTQFVTYENGFKYRKRCDPDRGDVLICSRGTIGRCAAIETDRIFCIMGSVILLKPSSSTSYKYLLRYLQSPLAQQWMRGNSSATAVPALYLKDVANCLIPFPPLPEQHRIVAKVDELMALCDRLEARQQDAQAAHARLVQALLDSLTQARDAEEFEDNWRRLAGQLELVLTTDESTDAVKQAVLRLAFSGRLLGRPFADMGDGETTMPDDWREVQIADIADVGTGSTPARTNPAYFDPPEFPWVTSGETSAARINATAQHVSARALAETNLTIYPPGTLIVAMYGQGKTRGQVSELAIKACTNQACAAIQLKDLSPVHRQYVKYFFEKSYDELRDLAAGGAQPNLNLGKIKSMRIPLPSLAEQHRIVAKVTELLALCDQLKAKIAAARAKQAQLAEALVKQAVATAAG